MAASAGDGEAFVVEQALDVQDGVDVLAAIEAMALGAFHRLQHRELGLPIAQHEGLGVGQAADFANAEETLAGANSGANSGSNSKWPLSDIASLSYADLRAVSIADAMPARSASAARFSRLLAFADALEEANRRTRKVELLAQPILEEALEAEVQALSLVGEQNETSAATWKPA